MIHADILKKYIIKPALQYVEMESEAAIQLLLGTCAQESHMGHYIKQLNNGPAIGVYQIEPDTHKDIIYNYVIYRDDLNKKIQAIQCGQNLNEHLEASIFYQTIMARLVYMRVKEPLPDAEDVKGMANYWKKYYNTIKGKGTPEEFLENYYRYVSAP